jgi:hypothetical protein
MASTRAKGPSSRHLRHAAIARVGDQIVREDDGEGLVADHGARAEHRVAEPEGHRLAHGDAGDSAGKHLLNLGQLLRLAAGFELALELRRAVEVILDGTLGAAGDEYQLGDTRRDGFLGGVLNERLVDDRQHLLGGHLGGRQEARAEARDGENGLANSGHRLACSMGMTLLGSGAFTGWLYSGTSAPSNERRAGSS